MLRVLPFGIFLASVDNDAPDHLATRQTKPIAGLSGVMHSNTLIDR